MSGDAGRATFSPERGRLCGPSLPDAGRWGDVIRPGLLPDTKVPVPVSELELSLVRVTKGGVSVNTRVGVSVSV